MTTREKNQETTLIEEITQEIILLHKTFTKLPDKRRQTQNSENFWLPHYDFSRKGDDGCQGAAETEKQLRLTGQR